MQSCRQVAELSVFAFLCSVPTLVSKPRSQSDLAELVEHKYGYRVLMQLLQPDCGRYLPTQLLAIARPPAKLYTAGAVQKQQQPAPEQSAMYTGGVGAVEGDPEGEKVGASVCQ